MSELLTEHNNNMNSVLQTASGASYVSSIILFFAGLTLSQWLSLLGAILAVLTYLTNLWFRLDERKRQNELHELQMQKMQHEMRSVRGDTHENTV